MTESDWRRFLTKFNRELLSYEEVVKSLSRDVRKAGWLGFPGAKASEIIATERRLGIRFPRSYREFLKASNGWRFPSVSISDLRPLEKVAWFSQENLPWIDAYVRPATGLPAIPDKKYFVYGKKQESVNFRPAYLQTALQISEVDDSAVVLLNPKVVTPDGEWETWLFANWLPGAVRYRSFGEWLAQERKICRTRLKPLPKEKDPVNRKAATKASRVGARPKKWWGKK